MNIVKIKDVATYRKDFIEIDDSVSYKRCRVQLHRKGVKLRDRVKGEVIKTKKQRLCNEGDFVVAEMDAKFGGYGIIPKELEGAIVSSHYYLYRLCEKKLLPKFLGIIIDSGLLQKQIKAFGSTNYSRVSAKEILEYDIPCPSLEVQEKIITFYSKFKDKGMQVEKELTHQQTLLKKLRQQILQDAIEGKLTADWRAENRDTEPASELLKRIAAAKARRVKSNKLKPPKPLLPINAAEQPFALPKGWVWCRLGDVIQLSNNLNIHSKLASDTTIHYVDIDTIDNKNFRIKAPKVAPVAALSSRARRILIPGYIVYSMVRPYLNNVAIVSENHAHYIGTTGLIVFRGINVKTEYLFTYLLSSYLRASHINLLSGFNSPSITQEQFLTTLLPLPPFAEQKAIAAKVEKLRTLCNQLETQLTTSQTHTNQLMQALLSEVFTPAAR